MLHAPFPKSVVDIYVSEIPALLRSFSLFLGEDRLTRRIETAEKMLAGASPTFGWGWVRPKQFLWFGTRDVRRLHNGSRLRQEFMTPAIVSALHHIASIRSILHTMPAWKKNELRSRLLDKNGGDIPALIEVAVASRIVTLGGTIKWMPERSPGERVFEFLASYNREKFEVECKAKTVDAGRKVARAAVYQFADRLAFSEPYQNAKRQPRHLKITTTSRFPTDLREQATLTKAIEALLQDEGTNELAFATVSI